MSRRAREAARALVVECLLGLGERRARIPALAAGEVDWRLLLDVAGRHAIAEGLHLALARHGAAPPSPAGAALRAEHELAAARNSMLLAEAARVQGALSAAGIASVLLKGTALLATVRALAGARHVGDIDLLVSPEDLARADAIARAAGCRPQGGPATFHDGEPPGPGDLHHAPTLLTVAGATLELHERPGHARSTATWTSGLLSRRVALASGAGTIFVPSLDDQLAVLCEHVFDGHRGERRLLPRHLGDLAVLVGAGASFERAATLPGAEGAVARSRALFEGASRGEPVTARLFLRPGDGLLARVSGHLAAIDPARGGAWRAFVPAPAFMSSRYGVRARGLIPVLYLWRPLRAVWQLVTGR